MVDVTHARLDIILLEEQEFVLFAQNINGLQQDHQNVQIVQQIVLHVIKQLVNVQNVKMDILLIQVIVQLVYKEHI